jgi:2-iminobutanoate/2-iminopropanoate deaminase
MPMRNQLSCPILVLLLFFSLLAQGQQKQAIEPPGVQTAGPYSPGILANGTLYVAGQVGRTVDGKYPQGFEEEVKQCLENVGAILKAAKYDFSDAVAVQVYLTDMSTFQAMNKVYATYFSKPYPARTTVGVKELVGPARIEITVTAWKPQR